MTVASGGVDSFVGNAVHDVFSSFPLLLGVKLVVPCFLGDFHSINLNITRYTVPNILMITLAM